MWKFFKDNIMRNGCIVASYENEQGIRILDVYEGKYEHYTVPRHEFIKPFSISYKEEGKVVERNGTTDEMIFRKLEYACKKIEENYNSQCSEILPFLLSNK